MKTKILSILALAAAMVSCSESWEPQTEKTGQVALSSLGVEVAGAEEVVGSTVNPKKGASRAEVDLKPFIVKIFKESGELQAQWKYADMPEVFTLPVGAYTVKVGSHEVQKAEWEHPYFEGSKAFTIVNSKITNVGTVKCTFASLKVSIRFADDLRDVMGSDVQVKVVANDEGELIYTPDETRAGYYEVVEGSTTLAATFTGTVKGYKENIHKVYTDIKAGQHRIITFSLKRNPQVPDPSTGQIDPNDGINVDTSITDEDINGDTDIDEDPENPERPGGEDFKDKVEISSGMDFNSDINPANVADAKVNVSAAKGIASLVLNMESAAGALPELSKLDLATAASAPYGLPAGAQVNGQTAVTLDLAQALAALKDTEGTHRLTITVTDAAGSSAAKTLNFVVKAQGGSTIDFEVDPDNGLKDGVPTAANTPGLDGKIVIKAGAGIQKMVLEVSSVEPEPNFALVIEEMGLSGVDLAHPGAMGEAFSGLGIVNGDDVLNQTQVNFDITTFFGMLANYPGTHTFKIAVTDNDGNSKTYTIVLTV